MWKNWASEESKVVCSFVCKHCWVLGFAALFCCWFIYLFIAFCDAFCKPSREILKAVFCEVVFSKNGMRFIDCGDVNMLPSVLFSFSCLFQYFPLSISFFFGLFIDIYQPAIYFFLEIYCVFPNISPTCQFISSFNWKVLFQGWKAQHIRWALTLCTEDLLLSVPLLLSFSAPCIHWL